MSEFYNIVPFKDDRFAIAASDGTIVDDAQGWGYRSEDKATAAARYKYGGKTPKYALPAGVVMGENFPKTDTKKEAKAKIARTFVPVTEYPRDCPFPLSGETMDDAARRCAQFAENESVPETNPLLPPPIIEVAADAAAAAAPTIAPAETLAPKKKRAKKAKVAKAPAAKPVQPNIPAGGQLLLFGD